MNKNALAGALVLVVVSGWLVGARAQEGPPLRGEPSYGTPAPGQVGGPVENHPELCIAPAPPDTGSIDRAGRAWASTHPSGPADPSHTIECRTDPAHPNGPDLCYRASDHSRVYPGTPGKN